jgi:hypothetical protein
MVDGDAWRRLFNIYQVLENTISMPERLGEDHYTLLTSEHFLLTDGKFSLNTLLQSTTAQQLLMKSCDINQLLNVETKQIFSRLFNTVEQKQSVKIILTTQSEDDNITFLQDILKDTLCNVFVTKDEQFTWSDLTPSSQEKLLQNRKKFQGARISLNELMSARSPAAIFLHLGALLEKSNLRLLIHCLLQVLTTKINISTVHSAFINVLNNLLSLINF